MQSRGTGTWPWGGDVPPPSHHAVVDPDAAAGLSGMPPATRLEGQQDTLQLTGPVGAGDLGWLGRDPTDPADPVQEGVGMFARLHDVRSE